MQEEWRDIGCCKGYEEFAGLYEVSNMGRIRSLDRYVTYKDGRKGLYRGKVLKTTKDNQGYLKVTLSNSKILCSPLVHRLVALAFLPNPNSYPQVNHKDENPLNNRVDNLEWCSPKYNSNWGNRNIKIKKANSVKVKQYSLQGELLAIYDSLTEAGKQFPNTLPQNNIGQCCKGKRKTAYGYIWKYAGEEDK